MVVATRRLCWLTALAGSGLVGWFALQRKRQMVATAAAERPTFEPATADDIPLAFTELTDTPVRSWVDPVDGACPDGYPIKGNANSGIFHVPGGRFYERTIPERCYA